MTDLQYSQYSSQKKIHSINSAGCFAAEVSSLNEAGQIDSKTPEDSSSSSIPHHSKEREVGSSEAVGKQQSGTRHLRSYCVGTVRCVRADVRCRTISQTCFVLLITLDATIKSTSETITIRTIQSEQDAVNLGEVFRIMVITKPGFDSTYSG